MVLIDFHNLRLLFFIYFFSGHINHTPKVSMYRCQLSASYHAPSTAGRTSSVISVCEEQKTITKNVDQIIKKNLYTAEIFVAYTIETKIFSQFEIIINDQVSSFRFIWIPMLWVYGLIHILILSVRGSTLDVGIWLYRRQIPTSKVGSERVNIGPTSQTVFQH